MDNPYDVLRDRVQAAAIEYYACTMEHPGIVLVRITPQQCVQVADAMRGSAVVQFLVGLPQEVVIARHLGACVDRKTRVEVQIISDVEARIVVGQSFGLTLEGL